MLLKHSYSKTLVKWSASAIVLPVLAALAFLGLATHSMVEVSNEEAVTRQQTAIERVLSIIGAMQASEQLSYANWPETYTNVVEKPDLEWMTSNFGRDAVRYTTFNEWIVVSPSGAPLFSTETDGLPDPVAWKEFSAAAGPAMNRARAVYARVASTDRQYMKRQPQAVHEGLYVTDFAILGGKPTIVAVTPVVQLDTKTPDKHPALLISLKAITAETLRQIKYLVQIKYAAITQPGEATGDSSLLEIEEEIKNLAGQPVMNIRWTPYLIGTESLGSMRPALVLAVASIVLITAVFSVSMIYVSRKASASEQQALYASRHDHATGIANRAWFNDYAEHTLQADAVGTPIVRALLLIDCDHFKAINDTIGHAAGDAVIAAIGQRLRGLAYLIEISGRLGGDEFAVLSNPLEGPGEVTAFAEFISHALSKPASFEDSQIDISVSIGAVVVESAKPASRKSLLSRADQALYQAKRTRRGSVAVWAPDAGADARSQAA